MGWSRRGGKEKENRKREEKNARERQAVFTDTQSPQLVAVLHKFSNTP